jgi:hypothetical protein
MLVPTATHPVPMPIPEVMIVARADVGVGPYSYGAEARPYDSWRETQAGPPPNAPPKTRTPP